VKHNSTKNNFQKIIPASLPLLESQQMESAPAATTTTIVKRARYGSKTLVPARKKSYGKKNYQRSLQTKFKTQGYSTVPRWGFPTRLAMRHKYSELVASTSTTGSLATYVFNANGMYDPNTTAAGHQPMYFDELAAIYDHYTVVSSFIKITITTGSSNASPAQCVLALDDDTTGTGNVNYAAEGNRSVVKTIGQSANQPLILTSYWSAKSFGPNPLDNDNLQGSSAANPTEASHWILYINSLNGQTTACNVGCEIWYNAVWDELKTNAGS